MTSRVRRETGPSGKKPPIVKSGMAGKVTSGGSPQPDKVKIITEKRMGSTRRGT